MVQFSFYIKKVPFWEKFLFTLLGNILGLFVAIKIVPGVSVEVEAFWVVVLVAVVFSLINYFKS